MKFILRKINEYKTYEMSKDKWFTAIETSNIDLIKDYIDKGFDINCKNNNINEDSALIIACIHNNYLIVKELLSNKLIDVNYKNKWNSTALMWACLKNNLIIVEELLKHPDIDVNIGITNYKTALKYAKKVDNDEMVRLLKEAGAKE